MTTFSNLFALKTYFRFTAYHIHPLQLGFLSLKMPPVKRATAPPPHKPGAENGYEQTSLRPDLHRLWKILRCLPMSPTTSYSIISLALAFRIVRKHYLFKKKEKKKMNFFLFVIRLAVEWCSLIPKND